MDERGEVRIAFVIPYFYPAWQYGGTPRSAFELARGLVRRGHSVQVLTTDSGGETRLRDIPDSRTRDVEGIQVRYYSNVSNSLAYRHRLFWPPEFSRQIRERLTDTDILHIHELRSTTSLIAHRAALGAKVPYVISPHGGLRHLGKRLAKVAFDALWAKGMVRKADALIAVSPVEEHDAQTFGVEQQRIRSLPNAANVEEYADLPGRESFRQRWEIHAGKIVLFLGRLHWIKGADVLVKAFQKAYTKQPDLHLVIAGPDDGQEPQLRRLVNAMRMTEAVTFTNFLNETEKREALTGSDVMVLPSRSEVFALSAIESLLCGTPVVMSSACGLYPSPKPEQGVISFQTENVDELTQKILMLAGAERFRHNVAAGRDFVLQEFSADTIAAKAESIYEEILQRRAKPFGR
jgi:glycosyltransferase involved in cell wall biosynthesis